MNMFTANITMKNLSWLREEYLKHRRKGKVSEAALRDIRYYFDLMIEVMGIFSWKISTVISSGLMRASCAQFLLTVI